MNTKKRLGARKFLLGNFYFWVPKDLVSNKGSFVIGTKHNAQNVSLAGSIEIPF